MELLIYGIVNSMSLILMTIGFALAYGVSRIPNFSHGALYILTGYMAYVFFDMLGLPYFLAILLALLFIGLVGAALYQFILIHLRGMAVSEIIASFGVGLAILEFLRWAGLRGMAITIPPFIRGTTTVFGVILDYQRIIIILGGIGILFFIYIFTSYTKTGLAFKAIAQNERAALALGINSDRAAVLAVSLGAVLAGLGGVFLLPLGNITVEMGYEVLIFALAGSIVGGIGSWKGVVYASFLIGFAQILTVRYIASHWHFVVALLLIIIVLILKPSGLYGKQKELEERV